MSGLLTLVPPALPPTDPAAGWSRPTPDDPDRFVGRAVELGAIAGGVRGAAAGRGRLITVTGEAGVGRTRLCEEAAGRALASGVRVVWGRCWPGDGAPAFWPWPAMLERLVGASARDLFTRPDGGDGSGVSAFGCAATVVDLLRAATASTPAMLILDDLHHAPAEARRLTRLVADELGSLGVVLVVTERTGAHRPHGHRRRPDDGTDGASIDLRGLPDGEAVRLLEAHGSEFDASALTGILAHTRGRPGCLHLVGRSDPSDLPATLARVVVRRLPLLDDEARRVLGLAAVLGAGADLDELGRLAGIPTGAAADAVDRTDGLARHDGGLLRFADGIVTDAVLAGFGEADLLDAHARAATVTRPGRMGAGAPVEGLLRHTAHAVAAAPRGPDDARIAVYASRAAARALSASGEVDRAAAALGTAVDLAARHAPDALTAPLLVERAEAELATGQLVAARRHFGIALARAEADDDATAFAAAALGLGGVWVNEHRSSTESRRVVALQRRALRALPAGEDVLRCRLRIRLAVEAVYEGGPAADVRAALGEARRLGDPRVLAEALSLCHHTLLGPEHATRRLAVADEQIEVASACGDRPLLLLGLCWRTVDLFLAGDDRAEASLRDLHAHLDAVPVRSIAYVAAALDVMLLVRRGRLDDAERAAEACWRLGSEVGDADALSWYGAHLCAIRWLQDRTDEVLPLVQEITASPSLAPNDAVYPAVLASMAAECGRTDLARSVLARFDAAGVASILPSSTWHTTMLSLAQAAVALGDADLAGRVDRALSPYAALPVMPSLAVVCLGSTHRPIGLAARVLGHHDRAVAHLEMAVDADRALGNRPMELVSMAELAEALAERGDPGDLRRAGTLLRRAADEGRALGLVGRAGRWAGRADELAEPPVARRGALSRRVGHWVVTLDGAEAVVPHRIGLEHLARLLTEPGRELSALTLVGGEEAVGFQRATDGHQPVLDDRAVADYRRRITELDEEADDAHLCNDLERAARAQLELDAVLTELEHATGIGGRVRSFATGAERARTSVCKAISRAVALIAEVHPAAARVLADAVTTGMTCRYDGDVAWDVA